MQHLLQLHRLPADRGRVDQHAVGLLDDAGHADPDADDVCQ
jgi:hypothetical protein